MSAMTMVEQMELMLVALMVDPSEEKKADQSDGRKVDLKESKMVESWVENWADWMVSRLVVRRGENLVDSRAVMMGWMRVDC